MLWEEEGREGPVTLQALGRCGGTLKPFLSLAAHC